MSEEIARAAQIFRVLSTPSRLAIVVELMGEPACVHELTDRLDLTQPLVSQHLRVLRQAGLVAGDPRGRETVYRIIDDHVVHIVRDALTHSTETHQEGDSDEPRNR